MAANQIAIYSDNMFGSLTEQDVKTIHETIAKDCNDSQFKLFMAIAKMADANPILGEIYPTVYQGKLTTQFGIDYHIKEAKRMDGYLGYDVQLIHEKDEFQMHQERAEDGRYFVVIDVHSWGMPRGKVVGAYAFAYKAGLQPFSVTMEVDEVEHFKRSAIGMQKTMWTNYFNDMFKKHLVKRALKAAFGAKFNDEDEVQSTVDVGPYERKDITEEANSLNQKPVPQSAKPETKQPPKDAPADEGIKPLDETDPVDPDADAIKKIRKLVSTAFKTLGISTEDGMKAYMQKNAKVKNGTPTLAEWKALLKVMELEIEELEAAASAALGGDDDGLPPI